MAGEPSEPSPTISSVGIIIYRLVEGKIQYLLLKKSGDVWEPPKGRIDPGEKPFDAALRETHEEANLSVDKLNLEHDFLPVLVSYRRTDGKTKTSKLWLARIEPCIEIQISHEHEEFRWCYLDEVLRLIRPGFGSGLLKADEYLHKRELCS